jgi:hypothetical protein
VGARGQAQAGDGGLQELLAIGGDGRGQHKPIRYYNQR